MTIKYLDDRYRSKGVLYYIEKQTKVNRYKRGRTFCLCNCILSGRTAWTSHGSLCSADWFWPICQPPLTKSLDLTVSRRLLTTKNRRELRRRKNTPELLFYSTIFIQLQHSLFSVTISIRRDLTIYCGKQKCIYTLYIHYIIFTVCFHLCIIT